MGIKYALFGLVLALTLNLRAESAFVKRSLVITTESASTPAREESDKGDDEIPTLPKIYDLQVQSNVSNRYAKTRITSKVKNLSKKSQEATFSIVTPDKAFISGFIMEIDGKQYEAYVKEKKEAQKTYDQAVSSGIGAAHVAVSARDSNRFTVSVNVEPLSKATFYLTYEELLVRSSGKYELVLNIQPGQPVKDLQVVVNIVESRPLKYVKVPSLRSGNEISKNNPDVDPEADIKNVNESSAIVTFKPDIVKQKLLTSSLGGKEENGLSGQFVVEYDVERDPQGGEVLVDGGYFVHFFAPEDLDPLKKQIVFVLDTSGSMSGRRIAQLKEAMDSILGELSPNDSFSIVEFSSTVSVWDILLNNITYREVPDNSYIYGEEKIALSVLPPSIPATEENVKKAKEVVKKLDAYGGTNIDSALKVGLRIVAEHKKANDQNPIIVFLTDGEPTVSVTDTEKIISTITELNVAKVPIFSLSFGEGADRQFLQKLSLKNQGFARHIYEAADAYLQLSNFYKEISSPLLTNVTFKYVDKVKNITKNNFPIFFRGSELYTTGLIDEGFVPPNVEAWGVRGPIVLKPKVYQASGSLERLWAYLTVKQLLEQRDVADDKEPPTKAALDLALKYSFVTDVTSLVVVKPNATSAIDTEDASKIPIYPTPFGNAAAPLYSVASYGLMPQYSSGVPRRPIHTTYRAGGFAHSSLNKVIGMPGALSVQVADVVEDYAPGSALHYPQPPNLPVYLSTPFLPSTTPAAVSTTESITSRLPWLKNILNSNGTITINSVNYELGNDVYIGAGQNCTNSINSAPAHCKLLHECPEVYAALTDFEIYKKQFCELRGFAAVCCPTSGVI